MRCIIEKRVLSALQYSTSFVTITCFNAEIFLSEMVRSGMCHIGRITIYCGRNFFIQPNQYSIPDDDNYFNLIPPWIVLHSAHFGTFTSRPHNLI